MQYALAPLIVTRGAGPDLVIGNFLDPEAGKAVLDRHRLTVLEEMGDGLLILKGRTD